MQCSIVSIANRRLQSAEGCHSGAATLMRAVNYHGAILKRTKRRKQKSPPKRAFRSPGGELFDDLQVLEARAQVAVLGVLALQLDLEADVVHGVGVAQRILVADHVGLEEVEEGLVEGLHAELARAR